MKSITLFMVLSIVVILCASNADCLAQKDFRLGIIGLDTSHVIAFTEYLNDPNNHTGCKVIAAYKGGSPDIPSSINRVEGYTDKLRDKFNVEIVDTIEQLCEKVDGILLESVDGRTHLEQAIPVIAAKKPFFIDKPVAGNLTDVIELFRLAKENHVPCWSSSSLRYLPGAAGMKNNPDFDEITGCITYGPCSLEPHHPDLFWYGIHSVESLFTVMGTGCQTVTRIHTEKTDVVVGIWNDGRVGTYRGLRSGKTDFGAIVFSDKGIFHSGKYEGYEPLVKDIIKFFKTGQVPVPADETIEIYAFMSAADESKANGGTAVSIASVIEKAKQKPDASSGK